MKNCRLILLAISMLSLLAVGCDRPDSGEAPDAPFVVTPTELTFDAEGNSAEVTIEVGGSWQARVVEGADWIGLDRNSGEAGIHTLTVTVGKVATSDTLSGENIRNFAYSPHGLARSGDGVQQSSGRRL